MQNPFSRNFQNHPLYKAIQHHDLDKIKELLKDTPQTHQNEKEKVNDSGSLFGERPNKYSVRVNPLLIAIAFKCKKEIISYLIDHSFYKPDLENRSLFHNKTPFRSGKSAFGQRMKNGKVSKLKKVADQRKANLTIQKLEKILEKKTSKWRFNPTHTTFAWLAKKTQNPYSWAIIFHPESEILQLFIDKLPNFDQYYDYNQKKSYPVYLAAKYKHFELLELLINNLDQSSSSYDIHPNTFFWLLLNRCSFKLLKFVIERYLDSLLKNNQVDKKNKYINKNNRKPSIFKQSKKTQMLFQQERRTSLFTSEIENENENEIEILDFENYHQKNQNKTLDLKAFPQSLKSKNLIEFNDLLFLSLFELSWILPFNSKKLQMLLFDFDRFVSWYLPSVGLTVYHRNLSSAADEKYICETFLVCCQYNGNLKEFESFHKEKYNNFSIKSLINMRDKSGSTPLMNACRVNPKYETIKYLFDKGADPQINNFDSESALQYACLHNCSPEILTLFGLKDNTISAYLMSKWLNPINEGNDERNNMGGVEDINIDMELANELEKDNSNTKNDLNDDFDESHFVSHTRKSGPLFSRRARNRMGRGLGPIRGSGTQSKALYKKPRVTGIYNEKSVNNKGYLIKFSDYSPLLCLCLNENPNLKSLEILIDCGLDINAVYPLKSNITLLHIAFYYCRNISILKFLVEEGYGNVNFLNSFNNNCFYYALLNKNIQLDIIKWLIEDCNVNYKTPIGELKNNPLHQLIININEKGRIDSKRAQNNKWKKWEDDDEQNEKKTKTGIQLNNGLLNIIKYLIEKGCDINQKNLLNKVPLHYLLQSRVIEFNEELINILSSKENINFYDQNTNVNEKEPIEENSEECNNEDNQISVSSIPMKITNEELEMPRSQTFKSKKKTEQTQKEIYKTPFHYACINPNFCLNSNIKKIFKNLLKIGLDTNLTTSNQLTVLELLLQSITNKEIPITLIKLLIKSDYTLGRLFDKKKTFLHLIIENLANTNLHNGDCKTTLEIIKLLIEYGCDPNQMDEDGFTAFYYYLIGSFENYNLEIIKLLISKKCLSELKEYKQIKTKSNARARHIDRYDRGYTRSGSLQSFDSLGSHGYSNPFDYGDNTISLYDSNNVFQTIKENFTSLYENEGSFDLRDHMNDNGYLFNTNEVDSEVTRTQIGRRRPSHTIFSPRRSDSDLDMGFNIDEIQIGNYEPRGGGTGGSEEILLMTPLHYVCRMPNISIEVIKYFVEFGSNIFQKNSSGMAPLRILLEAKHKPDSLLPVLQYFIQKKALENIKLDGLNYQKILLSVIRNYVNELQILKLFFNQKNINQALPITKKSRAREFERGNLNKSLNSVRKTELPIHFYLKSEGRLSMETLKYFVECKTKINEFDSDGNTPLQITVVYNRPRDFLEFLLQNGADPNLLSLNKESIFDFLSSSNFQICKNKSELFIKYGASVNVTHFKKFPIIFRIVGKYFKEAYDLFSLSSQGEKNINRLDDLYLIIKLFLDSGLDPNIKCFDKSTIFRKFGKSVGQLQNYFQRKEYFSQSGRVDNLDDNISRVFDIYNSRLRESINFDEYFFRGKTRENKRHNVDNFFRSARPQNEYNDNNIMPIFSNRETREKIQIGYKIENEKEKEKEEEFSFNLIQMVCCFKQINLKLLKLFQAKNINFSCKDYLGNTILHHRVFYHDPIEVYEFLISNGCKTNEINNKKETVLHMLFKIFIPKDEKQIKEITNYFLKKNPNLLNQANGNGKNILFYLIENDNYHSTFQNNTTGNNVDLLDLDNVQMQMTTQTQIQTRINRNDFSNNNDDDFYSDIDDVGGDDDNDDDDDLNKASNQNGFHKNNLFYFLIELGIDLNHQDNAKNTVLHYFLNKNDYFDLYFPILKKMIKNGASLELKNNRGVSCMDMLWSNLLNISKIQLNQNFKKYFFKILKLNPKLILETQADTKLTLLHIACLYTDKQLIVYLLNNKDNKIDVNCKDINGITPIDIICSSIYTQSVASDRKEIFNILKLLVEKGAKFNHIMTFWKTTSFLNACMFHSTEVIKFLIENGANINTHLIKFDNFQKMNPYSLSSFSDENNSEIDNDDDDDDDDIILLPKVKDYNNDNVGFGGFGNDDFSFSGDDNVIEGYSKNKNKNKKKKNSNTINKTHEKESKFILNFEILYEREFNLARATRTPNIPTLQIEKNNVDEIETGGENKGGMQSDQYNEKNMDNDNDDDKDDENFGRYYLPNPLQIILSRAGVDHLSLIKLLEKYEIRLNKNIDWVEIFVTVMLQKLEFSIFKYLFKYKHYFFNVPKFTYILIHKICTLEYGTESFELILEQIDGNDLNRSYNDRNPIPSLLNEMCNRTSFYYLKALIKNGADPLKHFEHGIPFISQFLRKLPSCGDLEFILNHCDLEKFDFYHDNYYKKNILRDEHYPLLLSTYYCNKEPFKLIAKKFNNFNIQSREGDSVLHLITRNPHLRDLLQPILFDDHQEYKQVDLEFVTILKSLYVMKQISDHQMEFLLRSYSNIINSFLSFYQKSELTDISFYDKDKNEYKMHSFIINLLFGFNNYDSIFEKLKNILIGKTKSQVTVFIQWLYSRSILIDYEHIYKGGNEEISTETHSFELNRSFENTSVRNNGNIFSTDLPKSTLPQKPSSLVKERNILIQKKKWVKEILLQLGYDDDFFIQKSNKFGLLNDLKSIWNDKDTCNFQITVKKQIIHTHREILMINSDLYRGMFLNIQNIGSSIKDYSKFSFDSINALIRFFYFENFDKNLSKEIIDELNQSKNYYQVSDYNPISIKLFQNIN
ncbi:ankyrin repeat ph and sec7 domain containing protein secg-related [Anaeramoeba flamelloides]|uniref:Ankyrin repeat ph and sec7 domain containing protein secg-related n=1 Tax=Anaeramoeba flamelloides TaxID=1746091 RepID=A0AAV7Y6P9_9EUKA|nr:ankyrin repeat ph and sec7 domain containing protein secg-related [Anaeramoeba flamelloides]